MSYSRADAAAAATLRARLHEAGLNAFLDRYGLPAGQPWQPWLEQHLKTCGALVVLVGPSGIGEWQHREIQLGVSRQASSAKAGRAFPVIPVLLPKVANDAIPVGRFLNLNTWVDLRNGLDDPESLQRLIAGAQGATVDAGTAEKLLTGISPYRGLLPFREQDAGLFSGRQRFVDELVRKVGQRTATNVVAVIGRSGSGKSSIVYAGLFPALRSEQGLGGQSVWHIVDLRPHAEPLHQLALAVDPPKAEPGSIAFRRSLTRRRNSSEVAKSLWPNWSAIAFGTIRAAPGFSSMSTNGRSFTPSRRRERSRTTKSGRALRTPSCSSTLFSKLPPRRPARLCSASVPTSIPTSRTMTACGSRCRRTKSVSGQ